MMDEHELKEQFEATDYNEKGNITQTPPPPIAAKKKRITTADLNKAINGIQNVKLPEAFSWIGELDTRIDQIESEMKNAPLDEIDTQAKRMEELQQFIGNSTVREITEIKARLEIIERVGLENLPSFISDTTERFQKIELELKPQSEQGAKFVWDKLDNQDAAIGALANALRQHLEEVAAAPPEPKQEIESALPPQQTGIRQIQKGDIEAVASVCQTMTDVLMICRLLQAERDIPDEDRIHLLTIACRAAGVPLSPGLQIRAGAASGEV